MRVAIEPDRSWTVGPPRPMTVWNSETEYLQAEWDQFFAIPSLGRLSLDAVGDRTVSAVLDVGCGAGQSLIPFVTERGAAGVGLDINGASLHVARELLASVDLADAVTLVCAKAEALPVPTACFDVVICRGVLAYTDTRRTLAEVHRALRPNGVAIVQVGNLRNELIVLRTHLRARRTRDARITLRRIAAGIVYHVRGREPASGSRIGSHVFYSRRLLARELTRVGLRIVGEVPYRNPRSFTLVVTPRL